MMKCGIDIGSSLIKAVVPAIGGEKYLTNRDRETTTLIKELQELGVTRANVTGIGKYDLPFEIACATGNPIANEIKTQVTGTRYLLKSWCYADSCYAPDLIPEEYCLISIGTGASFTNVTKEKYEHLPYGSCFAGGWLSKIANHVFTDKTTYTSDGQTLRMMDGFARLGVEKKIPSPDLRVKDVTTTTDELMGEMIVASCGKLAPPYPYRDSTQISLALVNAVAIDLLDKLLMYKHFGAIKSDNIVLIGSTIASMKSLQLIFRQLALPLGFTTWIPPHAEYAGACGALFANEDEFMPWKTSSKVTIAMPQLNSALKVMAKDKTIPYTCFGWL